MLLILQSKSHRSIPLHVVFMQRLIDGVCVYLYSSVLLSAFSDYQRNMASSNPVRHKDIIAVSACNHKVLP